MAVCAAAGRLGRSLLCGLVASICLKSRLADCGASARPVERLEFAEFRDPENLKSCW